VTSMPTVFCQQSLSNSENNNYSKHYNFNSETVLMTTIVAHGMDGQEVSMAHRVNLLKTSLYFLT